MILHVVLVVCFRRVEFFKRNDVHSHGLAELFFPKQPWIFRWSSSQMHLLAAWLGSRPRDRAQCEGDLGARLTHASDVAFANGAESVVLIGGDCSWQTHACFQECASALATDDVVIGPACDGGYTLLAAKKVYCSLFEGIAWSTASVLSETLARANALGLRVTLLEPLEDVDDFPAWQRARTKLFGDSLE